MIKSMHDHYGHKYEDTPEEKTEVLYGVDNFVKFTLDLWSKVRINVDICADCNGPSIFVTPDSPLTNGYRNLSERGVRLKYITEITNDNIHYCKELMKMCDLRHLDEIKGNFGVGDGLYYRATAKSSGPAATPPILISCTVRAFVEQQQYFFDMLWKKAIPAKKRIREIEENLEREFIDTLDDPKEILEMIPKFISKASDEILILFSNTKTIETFERVINISQLLTHKAKNSVCIRILFHNNQFTQNMAKTVYNRFEKLFNDYPTQIKIQNIIQDNKSDCHNKVTMFIVDKDRVITIESHDLFQNSIRENRDKSDVDERDVYEREDNFENIGLATYSNSKSTVLSYSAIFDSLWNQTELYQKLEKANKRLTENENLQKDFINIAAHELRNPIQPIIGFTEILKNKATDAEQRQLHDIVYKNAKKLKQLTENILDITKIESQTLQMHKETFNLNQLIQSTISDFTKVL